MERSITGSTEHQLIFLGSSSTDFTGFAVQASPVGLIHALNIIWWKNQAVSVEALSTESASHKVRLISERPAEVAHFLEYQSRVIKRAPDCVWVVAALVVFPLIVFHHLFPAFFLQIDRVDHRRVSRSRIFLNLFSSRCLIVRSCYIRAWNLIVKNKWKTSI